MQKNTLLPLLLIGFSVHAASLVEICTGLKAPLFATQDPLSDKVIVLEQAGRIMACDEKTKKSEVVLDLRKKVTSGGEMGLLGLAYHPKYKENKKFYLYYSTYRPERVNVVSEFVAGKEGERLLLSVPQPFSNHDGGCLVFGPDGYLYIGKGDGGAANDPYGNAQNKSSLLGKILRIDIDKTDEKRKLAYGIPSDNPFAKEGGSPEIFAWGIRNPWRFSFDRETKALWLGDVGQNTWEEIDIVERGKNYGWKIREGKHCLSGDTCESGFEEPVWEYGREEGVSITGGYVYRGKAIPSLQGAYVYGDYDSGKIWALRWEPKTKKAKNDLLLQSKLAISSFGEDRGGEILVVNHRGTVSRLKAP